MCILYVYVCLSLDERRSIEDTPTCSSAAPQIPFCCWKSLFIPNIKEAQFFTKKTSFTFLNFPHAPPPTPILKVPQLQLLHAIKLWFAAQQFLNPSSGFFWCFWEAPGKNEGQFFGGGWVIFFQKKGTIFVCQIFGLQKLFNSENHLNEPSTSIFFCVPS